MNPFQFAIATSTGASARADKIDPANDDAGCRFLVDDENGDDSKD